MRVLLVHGPNLNRLGTRNPAVYGTVTLDQIVEAARNHGRPLGLELLPFQSNHEGELIDWLQAEAPLAGAVVVNPGGLAHYSVALRDALEDTKLPVVEVHISDPTTREPFRHPLITATAAIRVIAGKGLAGYLEALDFLAARRLPSGSDG
jgi:3-dehydroquinate dehydratase-2